MTAQSKRLRVGAAIVATTIGAGLGGAAIAGAATGGSTSTTGGASTETSAPAATGAPDPAKVGHGPDETLLTGTAADKVTAAALAAVPGGTIIRVETDSGDAEYEAHMTKADGTQVTVSFDASFKVTGTESGFGPGGDHDGSRPSA